MPNLRIQAALVTFPLPVRACHILPRNKTNDKCNSEADDKPDVWPAGSEASQAAAQHMSVVQVHGGTGKGGCHIHALLYDEYANIGNVGAGMRGEAAPCGTCVVSDPVRTPSKGA